MFPNVMLKHLFSLKLFIVFFFLPSEFLFGYIRGKLVQLSVKRKQVNLSVIACKRIK